ncbi:hypothetical protein KC19_5G199900 [Ceratodon purpureus]|uniref:Uncharacterized protein n=1 Tax=Ceratodon purpureus TaxID=3225 RepID=A0A8T0I4X7_CERPU|nr:hypothetical protein KC19_5G199900 [Ceratodon purpureus]
MHVMKDGVVPGYTSCSLSLELNSFPSILICNYSQAGKEKLRSPNETRVDKIKCLYLSTGLFACNILTHYNFTNLDWVYIWVLSLFKSIPQ